MSRRGVVGNSHSARFERDQYLKMNGTLMLSAGGRPSWVCRLICAPDHVAATDRIFDLGEHLWVPRRRVF
jgi:hypothetical protein